MSVSPLVLLAAYVGAVFVASVAGGRLSEYGAMTHMRTQLVMSLVAGFILGVALFHLLPHSLERDSRARGGQCRDAVGRRGDDRNGHPAARVSVPSA